MDVNKRLYIFLMFSNVFMSKVACEVEGSAMDDGTGLPLDMEHDENILIHKFDSDSLRRRNIIDTRASPSCIPNPCFGDRVCTVIHNGYRCICPEGSKGRACITRPNCESDNPCLNNGVCHQNSSSGAFSCRCLDQYTGPNCELETSNPCHRNPCANGGTCVASSKGDFDCLCPSGYSGHNCSSTSTKEKCTPNSCNNNGTCVVLDRIGIVRCVCPVGFRGRKCEDKHPDPCDLNPCENGGKCVSSNGSDTTCDCTKGYYGRRCQLVNPCFPNPCKHAGECSLVTGLAKCSCRKGFSGVKCEIHECNPNPCLHGGACRAIPGTGEHKCDCMYGYVGDDCEHSPCSIKPCLNGGTCVGNTDSSPWYTCACTPEWRGDTCGVHGRNMNNQEVCDPNPCKGGCQCKPSCRHEDGYICLGSEGRLGKNCNLPAPFIDCGSKSITVMVDLRIVQEYAAGLPGFKVFMSNTSSLMSEPACPAKVNGTSLKFTLSLPFDKCGTTTLTMSDGKTSVSNTIWMNRLLAGGRANMPIPVVTFTCQYNVEYNVVTSLSPGLGYSRTVTAKGKRKVNAVMELCKSGNSCPLPCPMEYSLTQGAVYTVGETLHLRIAPEVKDTTLRIEDMFLSCMSNSSEDVSKAPVSLVVSGCLPTNSSRYNPTKPRQVDRGVCVSFKVPFLPECGVFYIHANLKSCGKKCGAEYGDCVGRRRRSIDEVTNAQILGPIYVLRGNDGVLKEMVYPGDGDLDNNSSHPVEETPENANNINITLRATALTLGALVVIICVIIGFYVNWSINGQCCC